MLLLLELQRAVAREFDVPAEAFAPSFVVFDGIDAAHRLGVYRNTSIRVLTTALRISYPMVQRLVGEEFFEAAMRQFIERWPSTSAYLNGAFEDGRGPAEVPEFPGVLTN